MQAKLFWQTVTMDRSAFLDRLLGLFQAEGVHYCVVGGQAVNAYAEPVVSLDLDVVIATDQLGVAEGLLRREFAVESHPHSLNISQPDSDLRVQIQTDPRYAGFVGRATLRDVLGIRMPVASIEDLLQGKVWAASDPACRRSKRLKDLADIARLLEVAPHLLSAVPAEIQAKLI